MSAASRYEIRVETQTKIEFVPKNTNSIWKGDTAMKVKSKVNAGRWFWYI
jgi:hypothetical protein